MNTADFNVFDTSINHGEVGENKILPNNFKSLLLAKVKVLKKDLTTLYIKVSYSYIILQDLLIFFMKSLFQLFSWKSFFVIPVFMIFLRFN